MVIQFVSAGQDIINSKIANRITDKAERGVAGSGSHFAHLSIFFLNIYGYALRNCNIVS